MAATWSSPTGINSHFHVFVFKLSHARLHFSSKGFSWNIRRALPTMHQTLDSSWHRRWQRLTWLSNIATVWIWDLLLKKKALNHHINLHRCPVSANSRKKNKSKESQLLNILLCWPAEKMHVCSQLQKPTASLNLRGINIHKTWSHCIVRAIFGQNLR